MATRTTTQQATRTTIRKVRRVSTPVPWLPWGGMLLGALGLLLIFAVGPVAIGWIQNPTERAAREALSKAKASWADVEVSGQWVTVTGTPPSPEAGEQALAAVRDARYQTWLGAWTPATRVRPDFEVAQPAAAALPEPGPEWTFRLQDGLLLLEGEVPDAATREALEQAARAAIDPPRIADVYNQLVVVDRPAPDGFADIAGRGLANVTQCDMGVAGFSCDRYSLLCELPEARAEAVRAAATAELPYGRVGSVQVLANEAVASCEQALAAVLERSTIQFATASDEIDGTSAPVLDEVAAAAKECPGTLRIEGHTDNTGDPTFNDDLSQRRAASVRQALVSRGLAAGRLVAQGYGARRPRADNRTRAGRSQNRRIEIRVVRASD